MWQSPPFNISQPEQDTCHNPPLTKLTTQILPRHHLLHLTHETLTLISLPPSTAVAAAISSPATTNLQQTVSSSSRLSHGSPSTVNSPEFRHHLPPSKREFVFFPTTAFRAAVAEETTTISCKTTAPPSSRYRERSATATQHLHFLSIIFSSFLTTARRHSTLLQQIAQAPHTTAPATVHLLASAPATSNHPAAPLAITVRAPATTANTATAAPRTTICANQRRHALHPRSAQQQQLPTPCLTSHHLHPCENPEATPPRRKSDRRAVSRAVAVPTSLHETLNAANPSLEREKCTLRHVSASDRTVKLVNWSKLQIWLNERGRIGNWIGIKLLIN